MNTRTTLSLSRSPPPSLAHAADKPLLAIPGKVIYENKFDSAPGAPWKAAKGRWELASGVLRGSEKPEDKHGAVTRLPNKLGDFVIEYEFKFEGAKSTSLSINAVKDHMARIMITPKSVTVQRDDNDHDGPDKAVVFARIPADFKTGEWHKVRMEMVGDTMLGQVDNVIAWGSSDLFKQERMAPGFTVGGQSVDFRKSRSARPSSIPVGKREGHFAEGRSGTGSRPPGCGGGKRQREEEGGVARLASQGQGRSAAAMPRPERAPPERASHVPGMGERLKLPPVGGGVARRSSAIEAAQPQCGRGPSAGSLDRNKRASRGLMTQPLR